MYTTLKISVDAEGIATVTIDVPGRPMNVFTPELIADLDAMVKAVKADSAIKGVLITSGKDAFIAGADIKDMVNAFDQGITLAGAYAKSQELSGIFRRLETCGKPVAVAINGVALGGGFELALACHHRVLVDEPKAFVGLPEVKIGLLPGAGGTQRIIRLVGVMQGAKLLTDGGNIAPAEALKLGLVHALAPRSDLIAKARAWLLGSPDAVAPWDKRGFRLPAGGGSITHPGVAQALMVGTALVSKMTMRNYPAPKAILSAIYEGAAVPMDTGLRIESKYIAQLLTGPVARNLMRTMFVNKGQLDKLVQRPAGEPPSKVRKLGMLGAGMMGAGIANVSAAAGIEVVLIDSTIEQAEKGKATAAKLLQKDVERGRRTADAAAAILARITPTTDYALLADADLVIEAVFEDRAVKAGVTEKALAVLPKSATFASNTSTLPITGLASVSPRPAQFIGMHFFSPVEKMPLVEIILGRKTSQATLAKALDYVGQLRKTPIVVNDSRGFFTSRVFGTYCAEGRALLEEGVSAALIENAGRMAGMPVGPLAVSDEVSLELQYKVTKQTEVDLGSRYQAPTGWEMLRRIVEEFKRMGRKSGAGFYDYPADAPKHLWQGLETLYPRAAQQPTAAEVQQRLLYIQALESARCFEEGVVTTAAEADLGSILGIGFPAWTGGVLSYIDTIGVAKFVADCEVLARRHGKRFKPSKWLRQRAARNEPFYPARPVAAA